MMQHLLKYASTCMSSTGTPICHQRICGEVSSYEARIHKNFLMQYESRYLVVGCSALHTDKRL
jgi:hypothetical protein